MTRFGALQDLRSRHRRRRRFHGPRVLAAGAIVVGCLGLALGAGAAASASPHRPPGTAHGHHTHHGDHGSGGHRSLVVQTIFSGSNLNLTDPDDITAMGGTIFAAFQNGVGPQGQPGPSGDDSTVVELTRSGAVVGTWNLTGKCDGLTADPALGVVIATVDEDLNSSLYTIDPSSPTPVHYTYSQSPLPHNGGTDAITILNGTIYVSASAPGTIGMPAPQPTYPALYSVSLDPSSLVATVSEVFSDTATATVANLGPGKGQTTTLGLTDPDSNELAPASSPRFKKDFLLTSQGDLEQIYVHDIGQPGQSLSVLSLSQSVDDTAWATSRSGSLFVTDASTDTVDVVTGGFHPGTVLTAATPCDANNPVPNCANPYLATLNLWTGQVTALDLGSESPQPAGLLFLPNGNGSQGRR